MAKINMGEEKKAFDRWCLSQGIGIDGQWAEEIWPVWLARANAGLVDPEATVGKQVLDTVSKFEKHVSATMAIDEEIITKLDTWLHQKEVSDAIKNLPATEAFLAGEFVGLVLKRRDQSSHSHGLRRPVI